MNQELKTQPPEEKVAGDRAKHISKESIAAGKDSATKSLAGKRFHRFRIISFLGQGGMGRVFRAEDTNLKRQTALKILSRSVVKRLGDEAIQQFLNEAQAVARLDHPHIVRVYEIDEFEGVYYLAMELLEGGDLHAMLDANGPFDISRACQVTAEAAEGLQHAHQLGVYHRDIKPSNLMLTRDGRCKVADFGLSRLEESEFRLKNEAVGTPYYIPPEVLQRQPFTQAADQYSLAASLWYLLTGEPVFDHKTTKGVLTKHVSAAIPNLRKIKPEVPVKLAQAIYKALAKKPQDRHESCEQFARILRAYTIDVDKQPNAQLSQQQTQHHAPVPWKMVGVIAASVAVAIILGVVIATMMLNQGTPTETPPPPSASAANTENAEVDSGRTNELALNDKGEPSLPTGFITPAQAPSHMGQDVKVQGKIVSVGRSRSGKAVFLNFTNRIGGNDFYLVMFSGAFNEFPAAELYFEGKWVQVKGKVEEYNGKPQMKISTKHQIMVLE